MSVLYCHHLPSHHQWNKCSGRGLNSLLLASLLTLYTTAVEQLPSKQPENIHLHKIKQYVDSLLHCSFQVFTKCEVLRMVTDFIHSTSLGFFCCVFTPVIIILLLLKNKTNRKDSYNVATSLAINICFF